MVMYSIGSYYASIGHKCIKDKVMRKVCNVVVIVREITLGESKFVTFEEKKDMQIGDDVTGRADVGVVIE